MNRQVYVVMILLMILSGLTGGIVSSWLIRIEPVFAQPKHGYPKNLRAERLELVDNNGKIRAVLEMLPSGVPRLLVGDEENGSAMLQTAMVVSSKKQSKVLVGPLMAGGIGMMIVSPSGMTTLGGPTLGLGLQDPDGDLRTVLGVSPEERMPTLTFYAKNRKTVAVLAQSPTGGGGLVLGDVYGNPIWSAPR